MLFQVPCVWLLRSVLPLRHWDLQAPLRLRLPFRRLCRGALNQRSKDDPDNNSIRGPCAPCVNKLVSQFRSKQTKPQGPALSKEKLQQLTSQKWQIKIKKNNEYFFYLALLQYPVWRKGTVLREKRVIILLVCYDSIYAFRPCTVKLFYTGLVLGFQPCFR